MGRRIVFIAEMRNPKTDASSTQIMTRNLLHGFCDISDDVIFVPVIANDKDKQDIQDYYLSVCNHIIFAKETSKYKKRVIGRQIIWLKNAIFPPTNCVTEELMQEITDDTVVISQSPSVDTAVICKRIKKERPRIQYIQYWGDPLALSLITPSEYTIKRSILKCVEKILHKSADRIVYGTESLYEAEIELFPSIKKKAFACCVSYMPEAITVQRSSNVTSFGYFGNYYSTIRNLEPLYEAFVRVDGAELIICGSSDLDFVNAKNITIMKRISQNQVEEYEEQLDVEICVLNSVGVQIPGKIFYHTNTHKLILVILDGPRKKEIKNELNKSHRFIFCENNKNDINRAIMEIVSGKYNNIVYDTEYYSPEAVCRQILNG